MLYLDDKLPSHPKILKAAAKLGPHGYAQALAMYVVGLGYAREHLTDGFIPDKFVTSCGLFQTPQSIANVLCSRAIRLWHRTRFGYQIHDYHAWNRKAKEIKEKREKERVKKQRQRGGREGEAVHLSPGVSLGDNSGDSRARGTTNHVPRTTYGAVVPRTSGFSPYVVPDSEEKKPAQKTRRFACEESTDDAWRAS